LEGVLAFYPTNATINFVDALTKCAEYDGLDLTEYGLSNPVTLDDVLNKRDEVRNFLKAVEPSTLGELWQIAPDFVPADE
jgi:hypothetical protein